MAPERSRTVVTCVEDQKIGGRFLGLGLKTRGRIPAGIGAEWLRSSEDRWRDHEACVETKQSHEVAGFVRCSEKKLGQNAPGCVISVVSSIGVKSSFGKGVVEIKGQKQPPCVLTVLFPPLLSPPSWCFFFLLLPPSSPLLGLENCYGDLRPCATNWMGKKALSSLCPLGF